MSQRVFTIAHTEASTGWGGQEIRIFTEMMALRQRGHRLLLYAPPKSSIYVRCQTAGFTVHPIDLGRLTYPIHLLRLAKSLDRERIEVLNMHSSGDGWFGGLAGRIARVPFIIRSRHIEVDYPQRWLSRIAYGTLPHHVLTTSARISERLINELRLDPRKVSCLSTGIDLDKFNPAIRGGLRDELNLPSDLALVGMVAVLRYGKGHHHFLAAARNLKDRGVRAHFIIAGAGPSGPAITQQIQDLQLQSAVSMLGHREDVPNVLASLDIVVLPSIGGEGIPQALLQAQAMAKPVVASKIGGLAQVVRDGQNGFLVPENDPVSLAERIQQLADAPALRRQFGEQGRIQAVAQHSLERMCHQLERLYDQHLS